MDEHRRKVVEKIIWLRLAQSLVNERYKRGDFAIPIHLAMGHEAIAVAVDAIMEGDDSLVLTHRNIHYNLARLSSLGPELNEYYLRESGLARGHLGSMNLTNPDRGIVYTSSILGNDLPVAAGYALGNKAKHSDDLVIVVTGDGAMEEGAFYESLLFMKSNELRVLILLENNGWSLATRIEERRARVDLNHLASALDIQYVALEGNDPFEYIGTLRSCRQKSVETRSPVLVEASVTTLGHWYMETTEHPDGKFINYHAGPAPEVEISTLPILGEDDSDPLVALKEYADEDTIRDISERMIAQLKSEVA